MGPVIMIAAAGVASWIGFRHLPWYLLAATSVAWCIGYFILKPRALDLLHKDWVVYPLTLFVGNFIGSGIFFGLGYFARRIMR